MTGLSIAPTPMQEVWRPTLQRAVAIVGVGPSNRLEEGDLEWPCHEDPSKVWFILQDSQEYQLWDILGDRGLIMESDLTKLSVKLEDA